jgi:hypothetical protein
MTALLITRPSTGTAHRAFDPEQPRHRHTGHCWWDVARARWVCD